MDAPDWAGSDVPEWAASPKAAPKKDEGETLGRAALDTLKNAGGFARGAVVGTLGAPGDMLQLGDTLASKAGLEVNDKKRLLPTSEEVSNALPFKPTGRAKGFQEMGEFVGPGIVPKIGREAVVKGTQALLTGAPMDAAKSARAAGYVLPPISASRDPSIVSEALSGAGGKIKVAQSASEKNQAVTNKLAAKSLGLPEDTPINHKVLNDIREKAGKAYEEVKKQPMMAADKDFKTAVQNLGGSNQAAMRDFPDLMHNADVENLRNNLLKINTFSPEGAVELIKQMRYQSVQNMKNMMDPTKRALGFAQRDAVKLGEDLLERNLQKSGKGDLLKRYQDARKQIAKTYDVEEATNFSTNDVSAQTIAKLASRRPLSGELQTIADSANAFPKAFQDVSKFGGAEPWSIMDIAGAVGSTVAGRPDVAGMFVGRPLVRGAILSEPYQNAMINGPGKAKGMWESDMDKALAAGGPADAANQALNQ